MSDKRAESVLVCACGCGRSRKRHAVEIRKGTGRFYSQGCAARWRAKQAAASGVSMTAAATAAAARLRRTGQLQPSKPQRRRRSAGALAPCSCGRAAGLSRLQDRAGKWWAVGCDLPDCTGYRAATAADLETAEKIWNEKHKGATA